MKIIVDAFGGDNAPLEILKACAEAVTDFDIDILLTGDQDEIRRVAKENNISLNRMERGLTSNASALDEIQEKYGFGANAIVTMEDVVECLYNKECQGKVLIDDTLKAAIDKYYEEYGVK